MSALNLFELAVYFSAWIASVLYSLYKFAIASYDFSVHYPKELDEGWSLLGRKKDATDFEWAVMTPLMLKWFPYVIIHLLIGQLLNKYPGQYRKFVSIGLSIAWLLNNLGFLITSFLFLQPIILSWIYKISSLKYVWTIFFITLAFNSNFAIIFREYVHNSTIELEYIFTVILAWTYARVISYLADSTNSVRSTHHYLDLYHFCFYLPLLPSGPLIRYKDFEQSINQTSRTWTVDHFSKCMLRIVRYIFWWICHDFLLHFFHHSVIQYHPRFVQKMDVWTAAGFGYSLGQFFMMKYLVMYGLPSSLARLDGVDAPPPPKCIGRIHLYSEMWRTFDRGLYDFMLHYIYIPFKGNSNSLIARLRGSALTFVFVCIWHGSSPSVVVWSISNYFGICVETFSKTLVKKPPLVWIKNRLSETTWIRFQAIMISPLLLVSALSNFCFFTNELIGAILATKAIFQGYFVLFMVLLAVMCCCHVSIAISEKEKLHTKRH